MQAGIAAWQQSGVHLHLLIRARCRSPGAQRRLESGLVLLDECLDQIERAGWHERVWLAETLRLKGWVLMRQGKRAEAEAQLTAAIEWSRRQQAKSWELRSATTLAELFLDSGRRDAARSAHPYYDWFIEGHDTPTSKPRTAVAGAR